MHRSPKPGIGGSSPSRPARFDKGFKMIQKVTKYFSEVSQELSKVSWPTRQELYGSTMVVIVLCVLISVFIFSVDSVLNRLLEIVF